MDLRGSWIYVWLLCLRSLLIYNIGFAFFVFQRPEASSAVRVPQTLDSSHCFLMFRVTLNTVVRSLSPATPGGTCVSVQC